MRCSILKATVEQVKVVGAKDIKLSPNTNIIFAALTDEQIARLKSLGCLVARVEKVKSTVMPPVITPPIPVAAVPTYTAEGLILAAGFEDLRTMMRPALYGQGFNAAVIDSGIRETHEKVAGNIVYSKNFTSNSMRDGLDHGTGVASIILAAAPLGGLLNMKVLDDKGEGSEEDVVLAIDDCIGLHDTNPNVAPSTINLSLGAPDDGNPDNILRVACRAALDRGIYIQASAGNGGAPRTITCPATEKYVTAVGSLKFDPFTISDFSSRGPTVEGLIKPDLMFFGEDIVVASSVSDTATIAKTGTSFSAPFYTGAALLLHEAALRYGKVEYIGEIPVDIPMQVTRLIPIQEMIDTYFERISVKPEGVVTGKDNNYGYGLAYGALIAQVFGLVPITDLSVILQPIMGIAVLAMLGVILSSITKG